MRKRRKRLTRAEKVAQSEALDRQRDDMRTSVSIGPGSRYRMKARDYEQPLPREPTLIGRDSRAIPLDRLFGGGVRVTMRRNRK